jgi:hypothetical protein
MIQIEDIIINVDVTSPTTEIQIHPQVINVEISNRNGIDSNISAKLIIFTSGFEFTFNIVELNVENFKNIIFFNPSGKHISVIWSVNTNYINIESNLDLLNHKMLIY